MSKDALKVEAYFPTLIYYKDLSEGIENNASLAESIYAWRAEDEAGIVRSNMSEAGSWHSKLAMHQRDEFSLLSRLLSNACKDVFEHLGYAGTPKYDNMWANINPPGGYNRGHTHPNTLLSGTYYVKVPKDNPGCIIFRDPRVQADVMPPRFAAEKKDDVRRWKEVRFDPIEGRVLIFPSWLFHEVESNLSKENDKDADRISVAFNVFQGR